MCEKDRKNTGNEIKHTPEADLDMRQMLKL